MTSSQATISVPRYITTSLWSVVVFTDSLTISLSAYRAIWADASLKSRPTWAAVVLDLQYFSSTMNVVVIFEHREGEALAESARANIKEILVGLLYIFYEGGLIYIVAILQDDILKVLHTVWYALAIDSLFPFSYHSSKLFRGKDTTNKRERKIFYRYL